MPSLLTKTRTALALGLVNVGRVASYRAQLRAGVHAVQRIPTMAPLRGPFYSAPGATSALPAPRRWKHAAQYFGWHENAGTAAPDWHRHAFTGAPAVSSSANWWTLADFDPRVGDIKAIWEASRFDWVVNFAQQAKAGNPAALTRLNEWLADWCVRNPTYVGQNWKCGQEASIRVMHLMLAARILDQSAQPTPALVEFLVGHLRRIAPTMAYAVGQDNNHGTSEAAAMFIGGAWLESLGVRDGAEWGRIGRRWLEDRATHLIEPDGTFSQYSVNYHRVMLDTYSLAEIWRRERALPEFSAALRGRLFAATTWLCNLVEPRSGDAPNFGHNDGANLLQLTDADFRDYRPSVHLAAALFQDASAFPGELACDAQLAWLGVQPGKNAAPARGSVRLDDGGVAILRKEPAMALLRYPRYRFRPCHADALHVDLWVNGENLLRDGGTYSYADAEAQEYFPTTQAHNSVQFDDRDQMPRVSRFLWGDWVDTESVTPIRDDGDSAQCSAAYRDGHRASHARSIELRSGSLITTDRVSGFATKAVLRWRLKPGAWSLDGNTVTDGHHSLSVVADVPLRRLRLTSGWESRYYFQRTALPVLEVEVGQAAVLTSTYRWNGA